MGVLHGRDVLYSLPKLFMNDIGDVCKGLAQLSDMQTPTIDVDVSNVSYKVGKDAQSVANYLVNCAKIGVKFTPVCDGKRPISKQATNMRQAARERSRIQSHHLRTEILTLQRRLKNDSLTDSEKNDIREEVAKKQRSMKSKETQSRNVIQPNFEAKLIEELEQTGAHSRNVAGGSVGHVIVAKFQADAVMMGRVCSQKTLMVMTDDADIPIIAGDDCIAIKFYTKDGDIELVSTSLKTLQKAEQFLSNESKERTKVVAAKQPIFEGVADRKLRALMCLVLGCDVYPKGMKGVGAKKLFDIINIEYPKFSDKNEDVSLFEYLRKYLWEGTGRDDFDSDVVSTYIDAIVYEPTNEAADVDKDDEDETLPPLMRVSEDGDDDTPPILSQTYLDGPPVELAKYLKEYADNITTIRDGPAMERCKGVGANSHPFLCADGYDKCKSCAEVICRHCREEVDDDTYCLPCYAAESLVPEANVEEGKSMSDKRNELGTKWGIENVNSLTVDEVEDLYAMKEIATARLSELLKDVEFPVHPSSEMDADVTERWDTIMDIKFGEGGAFISDPDLDSKLLPGILKFFASLVLFESKERTEKNEKDPAIHEAIPAMLIDMAKQCRVDTGYRLLMRCVRHAFDSRCKSLDRSEGSLVMDENGEIGIRLGHKVPASMRKNIYDTEIVLTAMKLLCCKCTCQCGSQSKEKIACVHTLVLPYLLTVLLIEDMAEHMLIALASRLNASSSENIDDGDQQWIWSMSNWSDDEISSMKKDVITLMEAAGEPTTSNDCNKSLPELLHSFVVGTEKRKEWNERSKLQAKPSELGPMKDIQFTSTVKRAKISLRREKNRKPTSHDDEPPVSQYVVNSNNDNPCRCSYPNCSLSESTSPPQTQDKCKMPTCSYSSHRVCQDMAETENNWIHCENEPYCYECHPKQQQDLTSDTTFSPDYLKIAGLMKVSGCDMDDSKCVGFRLLSHRCVEQMDGRLQKLNLAEKEAKNDWKQLQHSTLKRTMNVTKSQLDNLKKPPAQNMLGGNVSTSRPTVTPSPKHSNARRRGQQLPKRPLKTPKKRGKLIKCNKKGCNAHNNRNGMKNFKRVPLPPATLKSTKPERRAVLNYYGRDLLRKEILRRMGLKDNDKRRDLYVCTLNHRFEEVIKRTDVVLPGKKKESRAFKLIVPEACAHKSSLQESTDSLGLGRDRALNKLLTEMQTNINDVEVPPDFSFEDVEEELASVKPASSKEKLEHSQEETIVYKAKAEHLQAELLRSNMGRIQDWEQLSNEEHLPLNPSLKRTLGMDVHTKLPSFVSPTKFFTTTPQPPKKKKIKKSNGQSQQKPRHENVKDPPTITLEMPDDEVKRRTGFLTMQHMLSYIFIVCNGDLAVITERRTVLTWLEEWFMHFEYKWGRTLTRMVDIPAVYGPNKRFLIRAVALKYNIERRARNSWPTYASYKEDKELRNSDKWEAKYGDIRPVMWDMTNIPAYGFSDADFNRMTYSKYYAMNCFKGGIFCQLCGWIGTAHLWPGAVSDTDYNKRAGYIQEQEQYQNKDLVNGGVVPFTNIYDKGYRAKMVAWRAGKQRVLQPVWADSDRRFTTDETLLTAAVATDRGANERAVNVCKRSWYVSRGFQQNACPKQLDDAWMTWSFQSNFMFHPVL